MFHWCPRNESLLSIRTGRSTYAVTGFKFVIFSRSSFRRSPSFASRRRTPVTACDISLRALFNIRRAQNGPRLPAFHRTWSPKTPWVSVIESNFDSDVRVTIVRFGPVNVAFGRPAKTAIFMYGRRLRTRRVFIRNRRPRYDNAPGQTARDDRATGPSKLVNGRQQVFWETTTETGQRRRPVHKLFPKTLWNDYRDRRGAPIGRCDWNLENLNALGRGKRSKRRSCGHDGFIDGTTLSRDKCVFGVRSLIFFSSIQLSTR